MVRILGYPINDVILRKLSKKFPPDQEFLPQQLSMPKDEFTTEPALQFPIRWYQSYKKSPMGSLLTGINSVVGTFGAVLAWRPWAGGRTCYVLAPTRDW